MSDEIDTRETLRQLQLMLFESVAIPSELLEPDPLTTATHITLKGQFSISDWWFRPAKPLPKPTMAGGKPDYLRGGRKY